MWLKRKLHQCCLVSCVQGASQSAWNAAWIGMQFVLDARCDPQSACKQGSFSLQLEVVTSLKGLN